MSADPENGPATGGAEDAITTTTITTSSSSHESPVLEPITTRRSRRNAPYDDDDLVSNLSRAMSTEIQTEAERQARDPITHTKSGASFGSTASRPPDFEVIFEENDPENPKNWPVWYRAWCLFVVSYSTWIVVVYSTSYTSGAPGLIEEFDSNITYVTLGITTYLLGLAVGCVVLAPMSELYGRRPVFIICMAAWSILIIPGGVANSLTTIITMRFFW